MLAAAFSLAIGSEKEKRLGKTPSRFRRTVLQQQQGYFSLALAPLKFGD